MRTPTDRSSLAARVRTRRFQRRAVAAGLVLVALCALAALVAWGLSTRTPAWWRTLNPADPATLTRARALENGAVSLLTEPRSAAPWAVRITEADASAWLACRLPEWTASQSDLTWPPQVVQVQVRFAPAGILLAALIRAGADPPRLYSARLRPAISSAGDLSLTATSVGINSLRLPAALMLDPGPAGAPGRWLRTHDALPESLRARADLPALVSAILGQAPLTRAPAIRLADGRRVRILAALCTDGALELTCRTEPR